MSRPAPRIVPTQFQISDVDGYRDVRLTSEDGTNRLTLELVRKLADGLLDMRADAKPLIIHGTERFFSAGADLSEIQKLNASGAFDFAKTGRRLMNAIAQFPAPVYAAIRGYCMGGGLDLALACHHRIAAPNAVFGHRGAALGLVTGWGGTQRLPRVVGKTCALAMFVVSEKLHAQQARRIGLIDAIAEDPVEEASRRIQILSAQIP
jgi:enoyl-CoA hydratase/carnithine racemase